MSGRPPIKAVWANIMSLVEKAISVDAAQAGQTRARKPQASSRIGRGAMIFCSIEAALGVDREGCRREVSDKESVSAGPQITASKYQHISFESFLSEWWSLGIKKERYEYDKTYFGC